MSRPGKVPAPRINDDEVTVMNFDSTYGSADTSGRKRLVRSEDRWLGGVAGGLADYFGLDPKLVRVIFIASCLLPGPQLLLYVILWFIMPDARA